MSNERHSNWSVTINNPTVADEEDMNLARQKGWKVEGQLERGDNGTPHYQLLVSTGQVRFAAVKKAFPRAHIEAARNVQALKQYVVKEETREGELPVQNDKYPSMDKIWALLFDQFLVAGVINRHPHTRSVDWSPYASDDPLFELDLAVACLIRDGFRVESILANPQNRTAFKKWSTDLMTRVYREQLHTQTASQPDTNENGLNISTQQVHIPNAPDETHLSQEAHKSPQASPQHQASPPR
jgi:hypothetical protein